MCTTLKAGVVADSLPLWGHVDVPCRVKGHALLIPAFEGFSPQIPLWRNLSSGTAFSLIFECVFIGTL